MASLYPFYFDANASYGAIAGLHRVVEQFQLLGFNPTSIHSKGQSARAAVEEAREIMRRFIGARPYDHVLFNSGATEGNNAVISAFAGSAGTSVVLSAVEHVSLLAAASDARFCGSTLCIVAPRGNGCIEADDVAAACDETTALVSVMGANNETGCLFPIREIVAAIRVRSPRAIIHSDIAQLPGKSPFSFRDSGLDIVTLSGHKIGALTGVGVMCIREGLGMPPFLIGGPQEEKVRAGTENVLGIVSMGAAAAECLREGDLRFKAMKHARDRFEIEVAGSVAGAEINCAGSERISNTSSVFFPGVLTDDLLVALDREQISVSAGSACSSGVPKPSHVLQAMGQGIDRIRSTLRVSFRSDHSDDELDQAFSKFLRCIERCRTRT